MKNVILCFLLLLNGFVSAQSGLEVSTLQTEYHHNPVGIDITLPRLSWVLKSQQNGQYQTAFRILVSSSREKLDQNTEDLWDSNKTPSDQTMHVVYDGKHLNSRMEVWWKVMVWDKDDKASAWSEPAYWSMGLLQESDWQAKWIADSAAVNSNPVQTQLRNGFHTQFVKNAETRQVVLIDLEKEQTIDAVKLFPALPFDFKHTPGFLYPVRFKVEVSNEFDFSESLLIIDRSMEDVPNPGDNVQTYAFAPVKGRFIKLTVTKLAMPEGSEDQYAFALAEMQILNQGTNIALNSTVIAPEALSNNTWKSEYLTDGINNSSSGKSENGALPATYARKSFRINSPVKKATAYVSALGLYEFRINGQKVGDMLLSPEWTDYYKRVSYQTFDVSPLLKEGENATGAILGEGWYAGELMLYGRYAYGHYPRFLAQLEIELADGTKQVIVTDDTWKTTNKGPITASGIYFGEIYDANLEQTEWDCPGFDDSSWIQAYSQNLTSQRLVWLRNEPIRVEMELKPKKITEPEPGVYIVDFGQNMVGWCHFKLNGIAGKTIKIRHGEAINDDGTLYTANLRAAPQIDYYTPKENGTFEYEPRFTYHGFQYVEVSGVSQPPSMESFIGKVFHSSSPVTGNFSCSDNSLNQLMSNILWTQRANLMSSPNDCPQRDERFGWMGDIQAFAQTGIFNMNLGAFFTKFSQDIRDSQSDDGKFPDFAPHPGKPSDGFRGAPAWGDAGVFVPWTAFINYADTRLLEEQFPAAKAWVDYIRRNNPDLIWRKGRNNDYNDWLCGDNIIADGWPNKGGFIPNDVFATSFFARSTELVSLIAGVINRPIEATYYKQLHEHIKEAFVREFVDTEGKIKGGTQAGYALALNFNLLPDHLRSKAIAYILENMRDKYNGHLSTGIQTTHRLMLELTKNGHNEKAWQLLTKRSFPSWMYMIDNGATTIWERWDGYVKGRGFQDPGMNSLNHWAFGAIGEWMWRHIIGINPDETKPGWKHFFIAPKPGGNLTWAKGSYQSIRGEIISDWKIEKGKFHHQIVIPPNTTATVRIPAEKGDILLNGEKIQPPTENNIATVTLESGSYQLISNYKK